MMDGVYVDVEAADNSGKYCYFPKVYKVLNSYRVTK